jgi:serine/threonine protein kinase
VLKEPGNNRLSKRFSGTRAIDLPSQERAHRPGNPGLWQKLIRLFGRQPSIIEPQSKADLEANASQESPPNEEPVILLGQYEILGEIGQGGFGRVFKARDVHLSQVVAVKELYGETPVALKREANVLSGLRHENIVGFRQLFPEREGWYMVMDFVDGMSLAQWVRTEQLYADGPEKALRRIVSWALQAAIGLNYAHQQSIIHQDVKPANVLITQAGIAKVADFGLAKACSVARPHRSGASQTGITVSVGGMTPAYCSPEQASGDRLSSATDVWSWAVSVLELFMGGVTWAQGTAAPQVLKMCHCPGTQHGNIPVLPPEIADLLDECLQLQPFARPRMEKVVAILRSIDPHKVFVPAEKVKALPHPADHEYDGAMILASKHSWKGAFAHLKTACKLQHPQALVVLRNVRCSRCGTVGEEASQASSGPESASVFGGECPHCKGQLTFKPAKRR